MSDTSHKMTQDIMSVVKIQNNDVVLVRCEARSLLPDTNVGYGPRLTRMSATYV